MLKNNMDTNMSGTVVNQKPSAVIVCAVFNLLNCVQVCESC